MFANKVSDKDLIKTINKRLVRISAPPKVIAEVCRGTVTLTGQLKYENQRKQIVKAASSSQGVLQVIDRLLSPPARKPEQC